MRTKKGKLISFNYNTIFTKGDFFKKIRPYYYLLAGGVFLLLDQVLKTFARKNSEFSYYLFKPWIGWEYFENSGIAFGISVPTWFLIIVTPIIIILFLHFFLEEDPTTR
ncbi:MAG: hypothetical protein BRC22_02955, partial [Parcubacteria group bacterium QH_9_35_7]